jgi:glycosyltransferase involved in cell wall biosynthesis
VRLLYIADSRSVHTTRWVGFFARRGHVVGLVDHRPPTSDAHVEAYYPLQSRAPLGTRLLSNVLEVRRAVREFRPDVLHAHYINEAGWLGLASGFRPFVLTAWGSDVYVAPRKSLLARILNPRVARRADFVTADSDDQVALLRHFGVSIDRSETIGWGVDLEAFSERRRSAGRRLLGLDDERPVVFSPRRLLPNSNIEVIVDAFARLRDRRQGAVLVLKAFPDDRAELRTKVAAQIAALGLGDAVRRVEDVSEEELPLLYAAADVTVSVCSSDGTAVSILEAMASGSVVIAGSLPSTKEWIENGATGLLVAPRQPEELAAALERLLTQPALCAQLRREARRRVEARADRVRLLKRMESVYEALLTQRRKGEP